jgi:apolipoprotein N-acyltransferase
LRDLAGRIAALIGWRRLALAAAMGAVLGLAHSPFGLWPMAFVAGPVLYRLWRRGGGFGVGWAAGAAFFALTLHWIVEPFLVDAPRYGWMAPFALVLLAGSLALFWGAAFWLAGRVRKGGPAALALAWGGAEALRGGVFTGFPWVLPAYIWVDTSVAQLASVLGPYGLSLLTLLVMLALGARPLKWTSPVVLVAVLAGWVWGDLRSGVWASGPDTEGSQTLVRIIQPNIPQSQKWDRAYARLNFDKALVLTGAAPKVDRPPDVIIWPEVAVPFAIEDAAEAQAEIAISAGGAPVILGSLAQSPTSDRWRNTLFGMDGDGALVARYDKSHLVPFGEYMPFGEVMQSIGVLALAGRGLGMEAGTPPRALTFGSLPPFTPLICYESVFPREVRAGAAGADWIVLITNDAWFGRWAGPAQHLAQAQMRAIETGLPVARAANTGISAMISPYGNVSEAIPLGEAGYIDVPLHKSIHGTLYLQFGAFLPGIAFFLILLLAFCQFHSARTRH